MNGMDEARAVLLLRRHRMGLSQRELAERAAIHQSMVCNIEKGKITPAPKSIVRIAHALRVHATVELRLSAPEWAEPIVIDLSDYNRQY